jgi:hypothetical protein
MVGLSVGGWVVGWLVGCLVAVISHGPDDEDAVGLKRWSLQII